MTTTAAPPAPAARGTGAAEPGPPAPGCRPGGPHRPGAARRPSPVIVLGGLSVLLVAVCLVAAAIGAYRVPLSEVIGAVARRLGAGGAPADPMADELLWEIRFPRVVLGAIVGASLAAAGAALQGMIRNPLAEPGILGVSSGAAFGAALQIVAGVALLGWLSLPLAAFVGGLVTVIAVYVASRHDGRIEVVTLILTGIAANAFIGALIGLLMFVSTDAQLRGITFWTLGSLAQASWAKVGIVAPFAALGLVACFAVAPKLDLLALGESPARHLGVDVERLHLVVMVVVAVLTASAVSVAGQILFVGLVIPHVVRMTVGPGHRLLLPAAALLGAAGLVLADLVARTIAAPAELPLGVLTALVGAPWFFWLLRRTRARQGGWA
jgi:iron complex transport system permease protein